jgi:hypothetical protein
MGSGGSLFVQAGRQAHRFSESLVDAQTIPAGAWAFDLDEELTILGKKGSSGKFSFAPERTWPREEREGLPVRMPLMLPSGGCFIPGRPAHGFFDGSKWRSIVSPDGGRMNVGWGIGDTMVISTSLPYVLPWPADGESPQLVLGLEQRYALYQGEHRYDFADAPFDDENGILDFPHEVPPVIGRFGSQGEPGLLLCDPSRGAAFLYGDPKQGGSNAPRVWLLPGLLIASSATPSLEGQLDDLVLVFARKPGLLEQLRILETGQIDAEVLLYRREDEGRLEASPSRRVSVKLQLAVQVDNDLRRGEFKSFLHALTRGVVLAQPDGTLSTINWNGEVESSGQLPGGSAPSPFSGIAKNGRVYFRCPTGTAARVLAWPNP